MSKSNSTFNFGDSCPVIDETGKCLDYNSIVLDCIKDEIHLYHNDSNQSYHRKE